MPSFLFQGFTLVAWFAWKRDFKRLFSLPNFVGIAVFAGLVGGYFWLYSQQNSLEDYFLELWDQSSQRTVIDKKWYEGIVNIFTFPFENFGHLFPTSLLLLFMFRRGVIRHWLKDDFTAFTVITIAVNVIPYWLSPGYYPRYLFMLYPMVFILGCKEFVEFAEHRLKLRNVMEWIMFGLGCVLIPALMAAPFLPVVKDLWHVWFSAALLLMAVGGLLWLWFRHRELRIWWFFGFLVLFRIGFDLYVLPYRVADEEDKYQRRQIHSERMVEITGDAEMKILWKTPLFIDYAYYLGVGKGEMMSRDKKPRPGVYYVTETKYMKNHDFESFYHFDLGYREYVIHLVKLRDTAEVQESTP